jgi:hypothetical protein
MVGATRGDEIFGVVTAAIFARSNVVNVHEICVHAWHLTAMPVASQHLAPHGGRHSKPAIYAEGAARGGLGPPR